MSLRSNVIAPAAAALGLAALSAPAFAQAPAPAPTWSAPPGTTAPPPAQPAASPYPADLQAGGLTPPPATTQTSPTPAPTQTEKELEEAKKKDSKRGLDWFWINAEGGFSQVDLRTFVGNDDFTFGFVPTQATGGTVGVGLGVRLLFLTLGARGRIGFFDPWQMFTAGGEIGIRIPLGRVEPHFALGGGYAALGNVNAVVRGAADAISISGGYGRISGGVDVFLTPWLSVGLLASGDFLAMVRPGLSAAQIADIQADPSLTAVQQNAANGFGVEGSSYGTAWGATGVVGFHF